MTSLRSEKIRVTFKQHVSADSRRSSIIRAVEDAELRKGSVKGKGRDGTSKSIPLKKHPDVYEEWEFDDFADELDFEIADLSDSDPVNRLMLIAGNNKGFFERL
jgi:hypothetical protein